tara:strand:+ start:1320 stop:1550 length:231 start_codon:yes stop_codon:yes gene_type:complete
MKKDIKEVPKIPWGDTSAREIYMKRPEMQKAIEQQREREKKEMLRRKSPKELESDPRTTGAIEALKRAILGKPKKK